MSPKMYGILIPSFIILTAVISIVLITTLQGKAQQPIRTIEVEIGIEAAQAAENALRKAVENIRQKDYEAAAGILVSILEKYPEQIRWHYKAAKWLTVCYSKLGYTEKLNALTKRQKQLFPAECRKRVSANGDDSGEIRYWLGRFCWDKGEKAIGIEKQVISGNFPVQAKASAQRY